MNIDGGYARGVFPGTDPFRMHSKRLSSYGSDDEQQRKQEGKEETDVR
uniref:Uncharacterized protein n=1 Tax=Parascaris equorum TaxID=6256 RepID=A0A914RX03_PAREQ